LGDPSQGWNPGYVNLVYKKGIMMEHIDNKYLLPTSILDSDNKEIIAYADRIAGDSTDPIETAIKLYYAVRDGIWYDPYYPFYLPEHYRASNILKNGKGYCVSKVSLLITLARVRGIPSRIGFANVRNHLATRQLLDMMGSDLFVYHGFAELYLEGKWIKATPAFNIELCKRHNVAPLEFNGRDDSIFHAFNNDNKPFMEYAAYLESYADIPVYLIVSSWEEEYGKDRVQAWIDEIERSGRRALTDFSKEDVI
jgi:transglutaminase-like putative cysteine protease